MGEEEVDNRSDSQEVKDIKNSSDESSKTIIFCLPGRTFSHNFLMCWSELLAYCLTNNIKPIVSTAYDSNVFFVRNKCLMGNILNGPKQKPFQGKIKYDYVMWIDSDQTFSVNMFKRLLEQDKPVVSGMYLTANFKDFAVIKTMNPNYLLKHGHFEFLTKEHVIGWRKENTNNSLMSVDYCGMGFMLMKYGILEQLEYPWFQPHKTAITDGSGNILIQDFNSEDVYLCTQLRENGIEILVDVDVVVGHEKAVVF